MRDDNVVDVGSFPRFAEIEKHQAQSILRMEGCVTTPAENDRIVGIASFRLWFAGQFSSNSLARGIYRFGAVTCKSNSVTKLLPLCQTGSAPSSKELPGIDPSGLGIYTAARIPSLASINARV